MYGRLFRTAAFQIMCRTPALVGTFHKTGTVMMKSILEAAEDEKILSLWRIESEPEPPQWDVGFAEHCKFPERVIQAPHRAVVVIRDPRDVIISGAHYHCRADEAWLNTPEARFAGRSYREAILALDDDQARYCFEMDYAGGDSIMHMVEIVKTRSWPDVFKYEALVTDCDLQVFGRLFSHLGFVGDQIGALTHIALQNSLFGGASSSHIRNGAPEQWRSAFSPEMRRRFAARYDEAAVSLGYERTNAERPVALGTAADFTCARM